MSVEQTEQHDSCMGRFIDLANEMSKEGLSTSQVSWALMSASGIYATFAAAGNTGGLTESGIEKVVDAYKQNLTNIQALKRAAGKQKE